jgi:uncharacterized protein
VERRSNSRHVEARVEDVAKPTTLEGYASVYYDASEPATEYWLWDDMVERIMPGAFDRAVREDDVRALFNHDPSWILGRSTSSTLGLLLDAVGLRYTITVPDTSAGRDVVESVRRGDVSGSSFAFVPIRTTWIEETRGEGDQRRTIWIRQIEEVQLYDVGPVTYPAYDGSTASARSRSGRILSRDESAELAALESERERFQCLRSGDDVSSGRSSRERSLGLL